MSSVQNLRALINERLTAAAEEIFTEFEKTIVQYEEEIDRQRRLLDITWKPQITLQTTDLPQQHVCTKEEVLTEENVCNHERNSNLDQEDPEPPQMKEEQEELCNSQDGQQLVLNRKANTLMLVQWPNEAKCEEFPGENARVSENTTGQYEKEINHQHRLLNITQKPQIELHRIDLQQQDVYKQEVFADDQLCKQDRNCSLDQKDPEPPQIKEEQEELCICLGPDNLGLPQIKEEQKELCSSQEGKQLSLKGDTDSFMVICIYEKIDQSEPKPNTGQLLYHNSPLAESQDHEGRKHLNSVSSSNVVLTPKKTHEGGSSHSNNGDNSSVSDIHCYAATKKKTLTCDICGKVFKKKFCLQRHFRIHTGERPYTCEICGKSFTQNDHLKIHMRIHTGKLYCFCNICGKSFRDPSSLRRHAAFHTGQNL